MCFNYFTAFTASQWRIVEYQRESRCADTDVVKQGLRWPVGLGHSRRG